jgi:ABC-type phosphate transport system substrate-binding protein
MMKTIPAKQAILTAILIAFFWVVTSMPFSAAATNAAEVALIANPNAPESVLSPDEVQQIFLGRKTRWSDNRKIHFAVLNGGPVHEAFLKQYIGKTPSQFDVYWKKMVFTGKGSLPKSFSAPEDLAAYVAETPGAIGYAPGDAVAGDVKSLSVK